MDESTWLTDLAFRIDAALGHDPERLPLQLVPKELGESSRSAAIALLLEIALEYNGRSMDWLREQLTRSELHIEQVHLISLLRRIFQADLEKALPIPMTKFDGFGVSAAQLDLKASFDRYFLGELIADRYRLDVRIASGGVAVVYQVTRIADGHVFALKAPRRNPDAEHPDAADTDAENTEAENCVFETHLLVEGTILQQLQVDGIPRFTELIETERGPVLVLELIEAVAPQGFPEDASLDQKLRWLADAARIIDQVHQQDFIFADVKLSNMLVDRQNKVWLCDFNVSRSARPENNTDGRKPGSIMHMSQEALVGVGADADVSADIYALGTILYELIENRPFNPAQNREEALVASILKGGVHLAEFAEATPTALQRVCRQATSRHMFLRFATAADFADILERFLNGSLDPEQILPKRTGLLAWRLGEALGLCGLRIRILLDALKMQEADDPSAKLNKPVQFAMGYAMGVSIAAADFGQLSDLLGWNLQARPTDRELGTALYRATKLKVSDLEKIRAEAEAFDKWYRIVWNDLQSRIAEVAPEDFLLTALSLQTRFSPDSPTARRNWGKVAALVQLPASVTRHFAEACTAELSRDDWKAAQRALDYGVIKSLRWPQLTEPSSESGKTEPSDAPQPCDGENGDGSMGR